MPCNPNQNKGKAGCDNCTCSNSASTSASNSAANSQSFPIKRSQSSHSQSESTPLLWKTQAQADPDSISSSSQVPDDAPRKCEKLIHPSASTRSICCRELKKNDRNLIDPDVIRDCIIGLSDGLTVPFALTAGLSGIGNSRIVVLAGLAELISGAISMGLGGFLSAQAEVQQYKYQTNLTRERVSRSCQGEMEREVAEVLQPFGLSIEISELVASSLRKVEMEEILQVNSNSNSILPEPIISVRQGKQSSSSSSKELEEKGLTSFLLKHEGIQPISSSRIYISAITIGSSYFFGGLIPLLPYIFFKEVKTALFYSIVITGIVLLIFGMIKQRAIGGECNAKGLIYSALSTLSVGGLAAGASFAIVRALES